MKSMILAMAVCIAGTMCAMQPKKPKRSTRSTRKDGKRRPTETHLKNGAAIAAFIKAKYENKNK